MKPISDTAREMAETIDKRFGIEDVPGLAGYIARSLRDFAGEVRAETAVPEFQDPVDALTTWLCRRAGHDPQDPTWRLFHRQLAVKLNHAFYCEGMEITDLAGFFLVQD